MCCWRAEALRGSIPPHRFLRLPWQITTSWWLKAEIDSFPVVETRNPKPRFGGTTFPLETLGKDFFLSLPAPGFPAVAASVSAFTRPSLRVCVCGFLSLLRTLIHKGPTTTQHALILVLVLFTPARAPFPVRSDSEVTADMNFWETLSNILELPVQ